MELAAMNLREQFNADTKGYASFQEYCREEVDKKPTTLAEALETCNATHDAAVKAYTAAGII